MVENVIFESENSSSFEEKLFKDVESFDGRP